MQIASGFANSEMIEKHANKDKLHGYTAQEWMEAFIDVLNGQSNARVIEKETGLDMIRCIELSRMFDDAIRDRG
jgi:hypothetical protein